MAARSVNTMTAAGVVTNLTAVAASDTIASSEIGDRGVIYEVNNGSGGSINVTISDPGLTPAGNVGVAVVNAIANGVRERMVITKNNVDPATGLVTITHSATATVTAEAYRY